MKLISWNVNGLRACINKGFNDFLKILMQIYFVFKRQKCKKNKQKI